MKIIRLFTSVELCVREGVAIFMILAFSAATPLGMMVAMHRSREAQEKQFMTPEWQYITRQIAAEFGHDSIRDVRQCIMDVKLGNRCKCTFEILSRLACLFLTASRCITSDGFLVAAFKPGCFYW